MVSRTIKMIKNPWVISVLALAALGLTIWTLLGLGTSSLEELREMQPTADCNRDASETTCIIDQFLKSERYFVWVSALSLSLVIWAAVFLIGLASHYGKGCHRSIRWRLYLAVAAFITAAWLLIRLANENLTLVHIENHPIPWWPDWRDRVAFLGLVAAAPWIARIWEVALWAQSRSRRPNMRLRERKWKHVEQCIAVLIFMIILAVAVAFLLRFGVTAERDEFQGTFVKASDYPAYAVGLYGLLFTVVLVIASIPLTISWRRLASLKPTSPTVRGASR